MTAVRVGQLMKEWRTRRRRSQLDLALEVGVSARHLSFVETGRSRPSPELVLAVARHLDVPLREQNTMLLAAGYAPRYPQTPIDEHRMSRIRESVQRLLDGHAPYPGVAVDRKWDVVLANDAALLLTSGLPAHLLDPINIFRVCLHPDGLAPRTVNFEVWAGHLLDQLRRMVRTTGDSMVARLEEEVLGYGNIRALGLDDRRVSTDPPEILIPLTVKVADGELSLFTTLTTFGTPHDITLDELVIELFYPADEASEQLLRAAR